MNKHYENWHLQGTCDKCGKPSLLVKEYGIITNVGYDFADSLEEVFCLKCFIKMKVRFAVGCVHRCIAIIKLWRDFNASATKKLSLPQVYRLFKNLV